MLTLGLRKISFGLVQLSFQPPHSTFWLTLFDFLKVFLCFNHPSFGSFSSGFSSSLFRCGSKPIACSTELTSIPWQFRNLDGLLTQHWQLHRIVGVLVYSLESIANEGKHVADAVKHQSVDVRVPCVAARRAAKVHT